MVEADGMKSGDLGCNICAAMPSNNRTKTKITTTTTTEDDRDFYSGLTDYPRHKIPLICDGCGAECDHAGWDVGAACECGGALRLPSL